MPFMNVEVSGPEDWIIVDGPCGGETIPCDICGYLGDIVDDCDNEDGTFDEDRFLREAFAQVSDYTENRECWEIEEKSGYSARLSAAGYLDCTEWMGPYDSAKEARRAVIALYELCPACEDSAQGPKSGENPGCNFYHY